MEKVRITKIFRFEMAHALMGYDGLCSNIHGHSYELRVTVTGEPATATDSPKCGMLMDFSDLKRIVNACIVERFDHALVLNSQSDRELVAQLCRHYRKVELVPYQPNLEPAQIRMDERRIIVPAFFMKLQPLSHIERSTLRTVGRW